MITYLYHKRHTKTGLNYFGKTVRDPRKYSGSGIYWQRHLKKHGKFIETIQVWTFDNINECKSFALDFSIKNNIVKSEDWANCVVENGLDGQSPGFKNVKLAEYNKLHSGNNHRSKQPGFVPNRLGKKDSESTIQKKKAAHIGRKYKPLAEKTKEKISISNKGPRPHTAGENNSMYRYNWSEEQKSLLKEKRKGKVWWTNNIVSTMAKECPGHDWVRGRLKNKL